MSLLSGLLDQIPPTIAGADKPTRANRTMDRPRLVLVERHAQLPASTYTNAATATPEWRQARDQYLAPISLASRRRPMSQSALATPLSVSVEEAARLVGHSRSGIYEVIAQGELKAFKLGKRRLILMTELKSWIERAAQVGAR